jgi:hypothetical protein
MDCLECRRLQKAYHQILKERVLLSERMSQAASETDLGRFEHLSRELDVLESRRVGAEAAVSIHASALDHRAPRPAFR